MKNTKRTVSIVTPTLNQGRYLQACIDSVRNQTYGDVEHIIVDGGSTDDTIEILKRNEGRYRMLWVSEPDNGMYDAINKGFGIATGEIFAWLNSDDMYMPWGVELAVRVMNAKQIDWCTGVPGFWTEDGLFHGVPKVLPVYPRCLIRKGYYHGRALGWIQQESTFWTRQLWEKSGGVNAALHYAGDYYLWKSFAEHADLYTINSVLSGFRQHSQQKSVNMDKYFAEIPDVRCMRFSLAYRLRIVARVFLPLLLYKKYIISIKDI